MLEFAANHTIPAKKLRTTPHQEAQNFPFAFPLFSMFYNGQFVTHEIVPEKSLTN